MKLEDITCCCCQVASVVSNSVRPHRWQPTRLPCPWDSPGKNTGVGCRFLLRCMKVKSESEVAQSCPTLQDPMDFETPWLLRPWDFPGKSTGMGCHCLLRELRSLRQSAIWLQLHQAGQSLCRDGHSRRGWRKRN